MWPRTESSCYNASTIRPFSVLLYSTIVCGRPTWCLSVSGLRSICGAISLVLRGPERGSLTSVPDGSMYDGPWSCQTTELFPDVVQP